MTGLVAASSSTGSTAQLWPASYFTGPLGSNNVVPATTSGALAILWSDNRTTTSTRITDCARAFDGIGIHYGGIDSEIPGRGGGNLGAGGETWAFRQSSVPVVSWMHNRYTAGGTNHNTMQEVVDGLHDAAITEAATYWASLNFRIIWRPCWEFDGNWFPWSPTSTGGGNANDGFPNPGCTAATWRSAWQHMVALVQAAGASKVGFFWCPTAWFDETARTDCYPGDAYVDWCGADGYNQASASVQTTPLGTGWREFWEIHNATGHGTALVCVHDQFGPSKPFVIGETNSLFDDGDTNRKGNWYRNIQDNAFGKPDMPYLCGVQFFDEDLHVSEGFDWRVDCDQTYAEKQTNTAGQVHAATYQGFKDFVAKTNWNVGPANKETYTPSGLDYVNNFEGQADGVTITTGNSWGGGNDGFSSVTSTPTYSTTRAYSGTVSCRNDTTATYTSKYVAWTGLGALTTSCWFRFYLYCTANPSTQGLRLLLVRTASANSALLNLGTGGTLQAANAAQTGQTAGTVPIALNQWVRIEFRVLSSTTVGEMEWWLYNTANAAIGSHSDHASHTSQVLGANTDQVRLGGTTATGPNSFVFWVDDFAVKKSGQIGP